MSDKVLFLTNRMNGIFPRRVRSIFAEAGMDVVFARPSTESVDGTFILHVSETFKTAMPFSRGLLFPVNEKQVPEVWDADQRSKVGFFVVTSFSVRKRLLELGINPSTMLCSPLCWLPSKPASFDPRPIKVFVPCHGAWTRDMLSKFVMFFAESMRMELGDLEMVHFIVDSEPFDAYGANDIKITFSDADGNYLWELLSGKIVCCLGTCDVMEAVFLRESSASFGLGIVVFGENFISPSFAPESIMESFRKPKRLSELKRTMLLKDWFYSGAIGSRPFFGAMSNTSLMAGDAVCSFTAAELATLMGGAKRRDGWDDELLIFQDTQREILVQKLKKLLSIVRQQ
jgi:hypothetical protein